MDPSEPAGTLAVPQPPLAEPPDLEQWKADCAELFRTECLRLVTMLIWMGASWTVAEDAVQEAFSDLMRKWDTVKMPSPWLRQATKTHFFKILRRNRKAQQREHRPAGEDDYEVPDPSAEAALLVWEDQEWIDQLMRQLSPSARETLELILQDYSRAEIGALMGKTENAVRQNLHSARKQLEQLRGPDYTINGRSGPARTRGEAE